jgi:hypothetical protein
MLLIKLVSDYNGTDFTTTELSTTPGSNIPASWTNHKHWESITQNIVSIKQQLS